MDRTVTLPRTRSARRVAAALLLVGAASCSGSDQIPVDQLVRQGDLLLHPKTLEPYSGLAVATLRNDPSGVAQRLMLRNGTYGGPFETFFEDHTLSSKEIYESGVKNGPYAWYFENGQLFEEGTYRDGHLDGPYRAYWENGELYEEGTYRAGRFDGPRRWYLGGRLVELVTYENGVMDGLYERYQEDGALVSKGMLRNGSPCGMWIEDDRAITYRACVSRVTE
ncbi:MAG: toxin-antitoxin system YwqK family antitoxin [Gemmatimonadota bacterium]|nr:toxin-antitoxin system YwqK family antitoxin [Gemmatimonadota bacterium]